MVHSWTCNKNVLLGCTCQTTLNKPYSVKHKPHSTFSTFIVGTSMWLCETANPAHCRAAPTFPPGHRNPHWQRDCWARFGHTIITIALLRQPRAQSKLRAVVPLSYKVVVLDVWTCSSRCGIELIGLQLNSALQSNVTSRRSVHTN